MKRLHNCKEELNSANLKATPARLALLHFFENTDKPLDILTMISYLSKEKISADQATVFRIVNMFEEKGLVKHIELHEGKFRYELASKPDHHHLVCEECGGIEDISDCNISALEKEIKKKKKFLVHHHALEFFGMCKNCQG